jgi:hypothetical protein
MEQLYECRPGSSVFALIENSVNSRRQFRSNSLSPGRYGNFDAIRKRIQNDFHLFGNLTLLCDRFAAKSFGSARDLIAFFAPGLRRLKLNTAPQDVNQRTDGIQAKHHSNGRVSHYSPPRECRRLPCNPGNSICHPGTGECFPDPGNNNNIYRTGTYSPADRIANIESLLAFRPPAFTL